MSRSEILWDVKQAMRDIQRILIEDWDPIGVCGCGPDDEYDAYIPDIYRLLSRSPSAEDITVHLYGLGFDGLCPASEAEEHLRRVARKLLNVSVVSVSEHSD